MIPRPLLALALAAHLLQPVLLAAQESAEGPFVIGETRQLPSAVLGQERLLNIALPLGYHPNSAARYPVIYLLDGSADEDFIHVTGAVQFASFPWVDWVKPSIVVGIANVDRKHDLTFPTTVAADVEKFPTTGGSAAFLQFIGDELIPFIDSAYRTNGQRTLIGQSLGGLFATEVLFTRPELFARYVIVSPSLWWDRESLLDRQPAFARDPALAPEQVFIAVGKEGKQMVKPAKKLAATLKRDQRIRSNFVYLPDHDHGNILHRAVLDAVRWMSRK